MPAKRMSGVLQRGATALLMVMLAACVSSTTTKVDKDKLVEARVRAALGYVADQNYALAQSRLSEAYELAPSSPVVLEGLAILNWKTRESETADKYFKQALSKSGNASKVRYNYALFLMDAQRYEDAAKQLAEATEDTMYDNRGGAFAALGVCKLKLGHEADAQAALERAAALSPESALPPLELAAMHYRRGDFVKGWEYFGQFRALSRQSARSLLLGIHLARRVQDHDAEASFALELRNLYPHSPEYVQYRKEFPSP